MRPSADAVLGASVGRGDNFGCSHCDALHYFTREKSDKQKEVINNFSVIKLLGGANMGALFQAPNTLLATAPLGFGRQETLRRWNGGSVDE